MGPVTYSVVAWRLYTLRTTLSEKNVVMISLQYIVTTNVSVRCFTELHDSPQAVA